MPTIRGNHERQLLTLERNQMGESDRYTAACLRPDHFSWMAHIPESLWIKDEVQLVHGTPDSDVSYFLETVEASGVRQATPTEIRSRAGRTSAALILYGHSHIPRICKLAEGPLIVNPGSVGLPAYQDTLPFPHKMEAGSPHARYALVVKQNESWSVELKAVAYDWEGAATAAEQRHRPDWARALHSGRA
jgi:predicted phosphodiesterase